MRNDEMWVWDFDADDGFLPPGFCPGFNAVLGGAGLARPIFHPKANAFGRLAFIMFYHNVLQIKENSEGEEGAFNGDSDFRKLSLLLIVTWFPFPIWFSLSVEGFGLITDPLVIELGWVVLNLVSKLLAWNGVSESGDVVSPPCQVPSLKQHKPNRERFSHGISRRLPKQPPLFFLSGISQSFGEVLGKVHLHHLDAAHEDGAPAQAGSGPGALRSVPH